MPLETTVPLESSDQITAMDWSLETERSLLNKPLFDVHFIDALYPSLILRFGNGAVSPLGPGQSAHVLRFLQFSSLTYYDAPLVIHLYSTESSKYVNFDTLSSENKKSAERIRKALTYYVINRCVCILADSDEDVLIFKFKGSCGEESQLTVRQPTKVEYQE